MLKVLDMAISGLKKKKKKASAHVAQRIEHHQPANQRVNVWIPSQGTCLGCGPGPWLGASVSQPHTDVSLPLFLPPFPLCLIINNKIFFFNCHSMVLICTTCTIKNN